MSYYEDRIRALEARIEEMSMLNRMKAIPVEAKLMERIGELNKENDRLKALTVEMDKTINISQSGCRELKAEVERLTFDPLTYLDDQGEWMPRHTHLAAVERLKAEVERLTKAGDAMQTRLNFFQKRWDNDELCEEAEAWNAAKDGNLRKNADISSTQSTHDNP